MGEVITPEHWVESGASRNNRAEENRQRATEERAARQNAVLDAKKDKLSKELRPKIARNLGTLVEEVAKLTQRSEQQTLRALFEKYDFNQHPKRRRMILLKGEVPPSGSEALVAMLPIYRSLAKVLAGMNPRASLDRVSIEQRYQQRLVSGTTLSVDSEKNGGLIDVEAIGGVIDLLGDATKLLKARVPRLIEHFEALAISRVAPTMRSLEFGGMEPRRLTPLHDCGPMVGDSSDDIEEGVLTLGGFEEVFYLSEDEFDIEHHWPSTKLGQILVTKTVASLNESNPDLAAIAKAYRDHPDWELLSKADKIDLEGKLNGAKESWLANDKRGHFIDSEIFKDRLGALSFALDKQAIEAAESAFRQHRIERRFTLHLCVYPIRVSGQTDFRFGLYLSDATKPTLWTDPLFDAGWCKSNVALTCWQMKEFSAIRTSDVQALDEYLGTEEKWTRLDWFPTTVSPLNSPSAINWLGGRTLDWAMSDNPRGDRFKEGVVVVFEPTFDVPVAPASAPLATPAGMIERSILHDASGDDVLSRIIQDAEARIEWFDGVQASWAEIHRQARAEFTQKINSAVENRDQTNQKEDQA